MATQNEGRVLRTLSAVGQYGMLAGRVFGSLGDVRAYRRVLSNHMVEIGVRSLPVVIMAGAFSGIVLTIQTAYMLESTALMTSSSIGAVVIPSVLLELASLTTGLVMASRAGASIAAELGNMRATDQIDALEVMGMNAVAHLISPRVIAGVVMFPVLYAAAASSGVFGGALAGDVLGYLSMQEFIDGGRLFFRPFDVFYGAAKTAVFGFVITIVASMEGFTVAGGAEGVGKAATEAVVTSCVLILFSDYLMASLLL